MLGEHSVHNGDTCRSASKDADGAVCVEVRHASAKSSISSLVEFVLLAPYHTTFSTVCAGLCIALPA